MKWHLSEAVDFAKWKRNWSDECERNRLNLSANFPKAAEESPSRFAEGMTGNNERDFEDVQALMNDFDV